MGRLGSGALTTRVGMFQKGSVGGESEREGGRISTEGTG